MEKAGGHTLEKHVSKANNNLIGRAAKDAMVQAASSFTDKKTAINAVKESLRNHAETIAQWLKTDQHKEKLVLESLHPYSIGKSVPQKNSHVIYDLTKSRMILVKDSNLDLGFKIVTMFPVIK